MMLRVFIVDDEPPARVRLKTLLSDIEPELPHQVVGQAGNALDALDGILATKPDVLLLDIQMPGMTGLELADHLLHHPQTDTPFPDIIFVTAYDEYAVRAFDVHALDYLLKPVRAERLLAALHRVQNRLNQDPSQKIALSETVEALQIKRSAFLVRERGRIVLIPVTDVLYLKAELKYVTLRTQEREYLLEESLVSIEAEWPDIFIRVHRNALVARHAIVGAEKSGRAAPNVSEEEKSGEGWSLMIRGLEDRLPVSRRHWMEVKALVR